MTNEEFREWKERFFASSLAAATYLDLSRDTVEALESGFTRKGSPYPVKHHIALACMAVARGLVVIPPEYSSGIKTPAPGRSMAEQTRLILGRADGTMTAKAIGEELKVNPRAVYAAVSAARKKGRDVSLKIDPNASNPRGRAGKKGER